MKIDRKAFGTLAMTMWIGQQSACLVQQQPAPQGPIGNTAGPGGEAGTAPASECVDWDPSNECIAWAPSPTSGPTSEGTYAPEQPIAPANECIQWDPSNECTAWAPAPANECVEWNPANECTRWE